MAEEVNLYSTEAENAFIGALFTRPAEISKVLSTVKAADLYQPAAQAVYNAMLTLFKNAESIDIVSVTEYLRKISVLEKIGGLAEITYLAKTVPTAAGIEHYAKIITGYSRRRALLRSAAKMQAAAMDTKKDITASLSEIIYELTAVDNTDSSGTAIIPTQKEALNAYMTKRLHDSKALKTGFNGLDERLGGGLKPGDLFVISAETSGGKSAFAGNIAFNVARKGGKVLICSLEMEREQLYDRFVAQMTLSNTATVGAGGWDKLPKEMKDKFLEAAWKISKLNLWIDRRPGIDADDVAAVAYQQKAAKGLDLLIIDYIQIMGTDNSKDMTLTRKLGKITEKLKNLAKRLQIPVIVLAQVRRDATEDGQCPRLSKIQDSGAIAQNADIVGMLWRPGRKEKALLNVEKNRNGETGKVYLLFVPQFAQFVDAPKTNWYWDEKPVASA